MNMTIRHEELVHLLGKLGAIKARSRAFQREARSDLQKCIIDLEEKYRREFRATRAKRLALIDHEYEKTVDHYLNTVETVMETRIKWEVYSMLYRARKSSKRKVGKKFLNP